MLIFHKKKSQEIEPETCFKALLDTQARFYSHFMLTCTLIKMSFCHFKIRILLKSLLYPYHYKVKMESKSLTQIKLSMYWNTFTE
jgi:hypothetical protein